MSRRKQAKPRAVVKSGADDEIQQSLSLQFESKDESAATVSDDDGGSEDDEKASRINDDDEKGDVTMVSNLETQDMDILAVNNIDNNNLMHPIAPATSLCEPREKLPDNEDDEEMLGSQHLQDYSRPSCEIYRLTDTNHEDDNSTDSFYSDLYSTHTSSSYSPSTSDGALTPNSIIHHHQHQHLSKHAQDNHDVNRLRTNHEQRRRRRFHVASSTNGTCDGREDNAHGEEDADADSHGGDEDDEEDSHQAEGAEIDDNDDDDDTNEPHSELGGESNGKKLRKIERDAVKSEKPTGEGIKGSADGSYQCQFCDKSFPRLGYLKKHEQSHAEHLPFKCEYCARLFKHKRSRDRHTKLHTGDRRYRCPHCEAAFSRSDHLKIHMKTHDTQKPFQCTVCNRGYNTAAALTSHMQNHKKQAALLGTGQALNYSPRSTGSGSSSGSFHKRRYALTDCAPSIRADYRKHSRLGSFIACVYCTKSDFASIEQLNAHIHSMHEQNATKKDGITTNCPTTASVFQLSCEYCTMKFPNIPSMFQHMRTTHIDRLTSPNSYFEHFNRLAASGTFSPRLLTNAPLRSCPNDAETRVKIEQPSPNQDRRSQGDLEKDEEQTSPTDLSQPRKRLTPQQAGGDVINERSSSGAFMCNQCNAALPDFDTFRAHLKSHISQETTSLVCPHCGITLRDLAELERHVISHFLITNSEFCCSSANCKKTFPKPDELQKHLFDSHIQIMYKCSICTDMFDTKVAIQVHFACSHSNENKLFRCSACMETFGSEKEFSSHVRTRHSNNGSAIQCIFCRAVCSSELEMHFHLAAHARQFRCPACPETFHVEFLLDRHMQTHHSQKDVMSNTVTGRSSEGGSGPRASEGLNINTYPAGFAKQPVVPNNNNNILEYNPFAGNKNLLQFPGNKFYSPLQVDTNAVGSLAKHSALMYGLSQRYFDANKTLMDIYNYNQENKNATPYFMNPNNFDTNRTTSGQKSNQPSESKASIDRPSPAGFSCGICERSDFRTESDVHSHRKIVHNLKTGVSLRCAYCNGNFKSRSELEHHMKTCHNSTGKHKCLICDEIFPSPAVLAEHKLQHSKVGQSGKCSHCSAALNDVSMFKSHLNDHNAEGQIPVQCICCRQTLHSDFEIGLHAKFHTKSANTSENLCALCLETLPSTAESRVCEKCCRKHNLNSKFNSVRNFDINGIARNYVENRCNLCKMILPHAQRLQEHLVEHTFVGCEERGYTCYICSSVFTVPAGLLSHMLEHGLHTRPYDCNLCSEKYFFRAELDNHLIEHEILGRNACPSDNICSSEVADGNGLVKSEQQAEPLNETPTNEKAKQAVMERINAKEEVKLEKDDEKTEKLHSPDDEDEEYIEVEKIQEVAGNKI